jgi:aarF domain-containing kinase
MQALERSFGEGPNAVIKNGVPDFSFGQITKSFFKVAYKFRFRLPPYYTLVLRSLASLEGFGLAVNPDFKTFGAAYPYVVRRLLLDYSPTTQRVLHSLLLDEKRQLKWDRISSLVAISRKSAADRAALDMVIVPNSVPEVVNSGEIQMQESSQTASNLVGLVLAKEGVGLRRVLLEADTRALALVFVSTRAAMLRRKVANAIGEGLFVMLCEKFSFEGAQSGPITRDASEDSSSSNFLPLSQSSTLQKRRRLEFLLKAMLGRLRGQILLFTRVGWSFITIICWALAIACHRYAVYISNVFLPTDHKTGAGMSQGQVDEHTRIRNKQGVVPTPL